MPSFVSFSPRTNISPAKISQGRLWYIWFTRGGLRPTAGSKLPSCYMVPAATAAEDVRQIMSTSFTGGLATVSALAWRKTITVTDYSLLVDAVSTLTVNAVVYTFVSGAPVGNQIQIGASNNATATNIATAVDADADLSASAATNVVTVIGAGTGVEFGCTSNVPWALDIVTTVVGNVATVAAAATAAFRIAGSVFEPGTQVVLELPEFEYPAGAGVRSYFVEFTAIIKSGDTQQAIFNRLRDLIIALTYDNAANDPSFQLFNHNIPSISTATLATALQAYFSATPLDNLVVTGTGTAARLTLTAGSTGTWANYVPITVAVRPSMVTPVLPFVGIRPNLAGIYGPGLTKDFNPAFTTTAAENNYDNLFYRANQPITGGSAQTTLTMGQNLDKRGLERLMGACSLSYGSNIEALFMGGTSVPEVGIIAVSQDPDAPSFIDGTVLFSARNVTGGALNKNRTAAPDVQTTFSLQPLEELSPGCPFGYDFRIDTAA